MHSPQRNPSHGGRALKALRDAPPVPQPRTVLVLDADDEIAAGVRHALHSDAGELLHGRLGKKLSCKHRGARAEALRRGTGPPAPHPTPGEKMRDFGAILEPGALSPPPTPSSEPPLTRGPVLQADEGGAAAGGEAQAAAPCRALQLPLGGPVGTGGG